MSLWPARAWACSIFAPCSAVAAVHASELNPASEKRNLEQLEVHCTRSLVAAGLGQYAEKCDLN